MPFADTWMDLEIIILSKSDRERQISYDISYMRNLKYDTNERLCKTNRSVDIENTFMVTQEESMRVGEGQIKSLGLIYPPYYISNK